MLNQGKQKQNKTQNHILELQTLEQIKLKKSLNLQKA